MTEGVGGASGGDLPVRRGTPEIDGFELVAELVEPTKVGNGAQFRAALVVSIRLYKLDIMPGPELVTVIDMPLQ